MCWMMCVVFFNDPATTEIYTYGHTLSLHDALPIYNGLGKLFVNGGVWVLGESSQDSNDPYMLYAQLGQKFGSDKLFATLAGTYYNRSEEHTSELQSLMRNSYAVFCLKKKKTTNTTIT